MRRVHCSAHKGLICLCPPLALAQGILSHNLWFVIRLCGADSLLSLCLILLPMLLLLLLQLRLTLVLLLLRLLTGLLLLLPLRLLQLMELLVLRGTCRQQNVFPSTNSATYLYLSTYRSASPTAQASVQETCLEPVYSPKRNTEGASCSRDVCKGGIGPCAIWGSGSRACLHRKDRS